LGVADIAARAGSADTIVAAHALARFAPDPLTIAAPGCTGTALAPLTIAALRLDADCTDRLRWPGFETIADLMAASRTPPAENEEVSGR
jgi:protein ImuB